MPAKIAIIGAGTTVFSLSMIRDLCLTPSLAGSTVHFMDIDEDRLNSAHALCERLAAEAGAELTLLKTKNRREALLGADFVILAALVGGHQRLKDGWAIARKHGYRFGGSLHIVHDEGFWINYCQLELMEDVLKDTLEICPNAWFMLVANPVSAGVTYLKRKYSKANIAGFCHGSNGVRYIARRLGLDPNEIEFEVPGVNHFIWLTEFKHKGEDAFPVLDRWIDEQSEAHFRECRDCDSMGPKMVDLYRKFGAYPIGDTGNPGGGAWGHWYHADDETERKWKEDPAEWYEGYFRHGEEEARKIKSIAEDKTRAVSEMISMTHSKEPMIPFIEAIVCDSPRTIILNILNDGNFVPGIPQDFQVEVPCRVSAAGVEGLPTKGLPQPLLSFALRDRVAPIEIELAAFESGSRELLLQLIMMDPWTRSIEQANALLDDILSLPYLSGMKERFGTTAKV
ncbi:hypothetical protein [Paenibacillus montanisoli]|uniref:Glycosyl hydrolase family 4 C-terminal domain-containing protein n=1 Tax=Paenibacillus montanisoli TaxID=2081970 RepID=A0A328TTD7_9BACL|nr:hypothetical protein [Paenibacillus montanisoli]RAP73570.1 hypothetical protein DL346_25150 [Paenibacillus montanisoli]